MTFLDRIRGLFGGNTTENQDGSNQEPAEKTSEKPNRQPPERTKILESIITKIDNISGNLADRVDGNEERLNTVEEEIENLKNQDGDDKHSEKIKELSDRIDDIQETINSFTEVYEAISSQYNPLINNEEKKQEQDIQEQPPKTNTEPANSGDLTIEDSITKQTTSIPVGRHDKSDPPEQPRTEEHPETKKEPTEKHAELRTQEHKSSQPTPHPQNQTTTHTPAEQKPQKISEKRKITIPEQPPRKHSSDNTAPSKEQEHESSEDIIELPGSETKQEEDIIELDAAEEFEEKILDKLIGRKKSRLTRLNTKVTGNQRFYIDGYAPLSSLLDLVTIINHDHNVFRKHVIQEQNFNDWIRHSLHMPELADNLRGITNREDYVVTLLNEL